MYSINIVLNCVSKFCIQIFVTDFFVSAQKRGMRTQTFIDDIMFCVLVCW